ncbi:MAG: hypothetical protein QM736_20765 [Vicinamibacterales bacterium]
MPRKRHYDLRNFWPWYERQWPIRYGLHATPPPFRLTDIGKASRSTSSEIRFVQVALVALLVIAIAVVVVGLFGA